MLEDEDEPFLHSDSLSESAGLVEMKYTFNNSGRGAQDDFRTSTQMAEEETSETATNRVLDLPADMPNLPATPNLRTPGPSRSNSGGAGTPGR